jgi:RNA polymerase sigma-70 factor (ECF subfamily)
MAELSRAEILRCQEGDHQALEALYETYKLRVGRLVLRFVGGGEDARDLVQETFLEIVRGIHRFQLNASLSTWIYRVAANRCLMFRRRRAKTPRRARLPLSEAVEAREAGPVALAVASEAEARLQEALLRLEEKPRLVFTLRTCEQLSYREITEVTGYSLSDVKMTLSRTRTTLMKMLGVIGR